jgi:tRNA G18 (ribose-2'-O)-methylase SpoU
VTNERYKQEEKAFILKAKTKNISIVLYKPKYAGNIGSVARAAKNMGISNIIVVGKTDFDREEMGSAPLIWPQIF